MKPRSTPTSPAEAADQTDDDSISTNRELPVVPADAIPSPPDRFRATDLRTRQQRLRTIATTNLAEAHGALREVAATGDGLQRDLGPNAPSAGESSSLLARLDEVQGSVAAARRLLTYLLEIEDIALSDTALHLERIHRLYRTNLELNPSLAQRYQQLQGYSSLHGRLVAEGIARRKSAAARPAGPGDKGKPTG